MQLLGPEAAGDAAVVLGDEDDVGARDVGQLGPPPEVGQLGQAQQQ